MESGDIKVGAKIVFVLLLMLVVFTFISEYTGAVALRYTSGVQGVHGYRYDVRGEETKLTIINPEKDADGTPTIQEGEKLIVDVIPGTYVNTGYKVVRLPTNKKIFGKGGGTYSAKVTAGGFGHPGRASGLCDRKNLHPDAKGKYTIYGQKCTAPLRVKVPMVGIEPGKYAFQVCSGVSINRCNKGMCIQQVEFKIVPNTGTRVISFFRGQSSIL